MKRMFTLIGSYLGSLVLTYIGIAILLVSLAPGEENILGMIFFVVLIGCGIFVFVETIIQQVKTYKTPSKNYLEKSDSEIEIVTGKTIKRT